MARSWRASSRSRIVSTPFMWAEALLLNDSGMTALGTTPYFLIRLTNMSHWPASLRGWASSHMSRRPSSGSSSVARMFS